jgi:hypothetical protein
MANSEHKLTNETKQTTAAADNYTVTVAGAGAVEKRASFDSGYHSNYAGGEGEGTTGETSYHAETAYYPPNGPGKFETPQSGAELFDERFRLMMGEVEGVMGARGSNATGTSTNGAYAYTGNGRKS